MERIKLGSFPKNTPSLKIYEEPEIDEKNHLAGLLLLRGVSDLDHRFENIEQREGFEEVIQSFKDLVEDKAKYSMLLVYGGTGNGKTLCCEATVISMGERGILVCRDRWSDIVRHLKELMKKGGYEEYFNKIRGTKYLIIDDVGSGSTLGSWEWGELEDIVDYRLERKLFTIITTNLDGKDIPLRILSRFKDKRRAKMVINLAGDYRREGLAK